MFDRNKTVWINEGDSSFPVKVKKGTSVMMSGGTSYKVGKKNDNKQYFNIEEKRFMIQVYGCIKPIYLSRNLDLKTKLELLISGIKVNSSIPLHLDLECEDNIAHVYDSYDQYKKTLNYFVPNISDEQLRQGIYTITRNGQVISLDKICFNIIANSKNKEEQGSVKKLALNKK